MGAQVQTLALASVRPDPQQHRTHFPEEYIAGLAQSIASEGQRTPIDVRPDGDGGYIIIAGECRFRALTLAGAETVRAFVHEGMTEAEAVALQASENLARRDVRPCEEARAYRRIVEAEQQARPWVDVAEAERKAAQVTGHAVTRVRERLALLLLPTEVQEWIDQGFVGVGHAAQLVRLAQAGEQHEAELTRMALRTKARGITVDDLRTLVSDYLGASAQGAMFGSDAGAQEEGGSARAARSRIGGIIGGLERVASNTFDRRGQVVTVNGLRADELATAEARVEGGLKHLAEVRRALREAQGKTEPEAPEAPEPTPITYTRQVAEVPEAGQVRLYVRGPQEWLWVHGAGRVGQVADLCRGAGARWTESRGGAWYVPDGARGRQVLRMLVNVLGSVVQPGGEAQTDEAWQAAG